MSASSAIVQARRLADGLKVDAATVTRPGEDVFDPETGLVTPSSTTIYTGLPCRLRQPTSVEREALYGEEQVTVARFVVDFYPDVDGIRINDVITLTASDDADVLTRAYKVVLVSLMTYSHSKTLGVEVVE